MTQLHVGRRYFITGAEPSQTQPEQIYDEDCGAGWREGDWERVGERRDTQICLIDTIKRRVCQPHNKTLDSITFSW